MKTLQLKNVLINAGKIVAASLIFICLGFTGKAETCTALANGNWSAASTWSCGHAPANNDTMWIPAGIHVTVDINSPTYSNMVVIVDGYLNFNVGQKINMCPGSLTVSATGELDGGNGGSKIVICGVSDWNGPGPQHGPLYFSGGNLPVALVSFDGEQIKNTIQTSWTTLTETNNNYFTVEKSTNGISFEEIGKIKGNGTTTVQHNYNFIDESPAPGTNYYRLTQTDINGQSEIFKIIAVEFSGTESICDFTVYSSPEANLTVQFPDCSADNSGDVSIDLIDVDGKIISTSTNARNANGGFVSVIDKNEKMAPGIYFIRVTSLKAVYMQKTILY